MGVALYYSTEQDVTPKAAERIQAFIAAESKGYEWWADSLGFFSVPDGDDGEMTGSTKLFCNLADSDTDIYMSYLDVKHIVKLLRKASEECSVNWLLRIDDTELGAIRNGGVDAVLDDNLSQFLIYFPGNYEYLKETPRSEILSEWKNRI